MDIEKLLWILLSISILFNTLLILRAKKKTREYNEKIHHVQHIIQKHQTYEKKITDQLSLFSITLYTHSKETQQITASISHMLPKEEHAEFERFFTELEDTVPKKAVFQTLNDTWIEVKALPSSDGQVEVLIQDITELKQTELHYKQLAYYDELTELPNRAMLYRHLKKALSKAKRKNRTLAAMFLDLDGFKDVNDTHGHDVGDLVLKEVAKRLDETVREEDFVCRLAGDEFIIIVEEAAKEELNQLAERLTEVMNVPFLEVAGTQSLSSSIGIAMYPTDATDTEDLLIHADKAMYVAKRNGKNRYAFFEESSSYEDILTDDSFLTKFLKLFSLGTTNG